MPGEQSRMGRDCCPGILSERCHTTCFRLRFQSCFLPVYSPLTSGYGAKAINMSSGGAYFVSGNPVFAGLAVHVLLRMPERITRKLRTEGVFDGRVTHGGWKAFQANVLGTGSNFPSRSSSESSPVDKEQIKPQK